MQIQIVVSLIRYARQHAVEQAEDWHTVAMNCFQKAIPINFHAVHAYLNILEAFLLRYCAGKAKDLVEGGKSNTIRRKHIRRVITQFLIAQCLGRHLDTVVSLPMVACLDV